VRVGVLKLPKKIQRYTCETCKFWKKTGILSAESSGSCYVGQACKCNLTYVGKEIVYGVEGASVHFVLLPLRPTRTFSDFINELTVPEKRM